MTRKKRLGARTSCLAFEAVAVLVLVSVLFSNHEVASREISSSSGRSLMSAPIDLLSESLASSTSLLTQLLRKRPRSIEPPAPSALASVGARRMDMGDDSTEKVSAITVNNNNKRRKRIKKKRKRPKATTDATLTPDTISERTGSAAPAGAGDSNEPLVYLCPNPDGCPPAERGQRYPPRRPPFLRGQYPGSSDGGSADISHTIYRQEVLKSSANLKKKKANSMRVRKKQRKPPTTSAAIEEEVRTADVPFEVVEMIAEMVKEAGPIVSDREVDMIADVSHEMGADVSSEQVKVITKLSQVMGPNLTPTEVETIAKVTSELGDADLPKENLEDLGHMVRVMGPEITPREMEQIKEAVMQPREPKSGFTDHGSRMVMQMMHNLGPEVTSMELKIVTDMIKEIDKDLTKTQAEVMATVLKEKMADGGLSNEVVHEVSAAVNIDEPTLDEEEVSELAEEIGEIKAQGEVLSNEVTPEQVDLVIGMIEEVGGPGRVGKQEIQLIAQVVEDTSGEDIQPEDVEVVNHIVDMLEDKMDPEELNRSDKAIITILAKEGGNGNSGDVKPVTKPEESGSTRLRMPNLNLNSNRDKSRTRNRGSSSNNGGGAVSNKEAEFVSEVVELFGNHVAPAEEAQLKEEIKKIDPTMSEEHAEVMTQVLIEIGPKVEPETVQELAEVVTDRTVDMEANDIDDVAKMVKKLSTEVTPEEVVLVAKMAKKMGPTLSHREMQSISRMSKSKGSDITMTDIEVIAEISKEAGPRLSKKEAELVSIMSEALAEDTSSSSPKKTSSNKKEEEMRDALKAVMADKMSQVLDRMGKAITEPETKIIKKVLQKMDPTMSDKEAETVAEVIQEAGPEVSARDIKAIMDVAERSEAVDTPEKVKEVAKMTSELSRPLNPTEMARVAEMAEKMGPILNPRELQAVSQNSGIRGLTPNDVEVVNEVVETLGTSEVEEVEMVALISMLQGEAEVPITMSEAKAIAEVVKTMGPSISRSETAQIENMVHQVAPELPKAKVEAGAKVIAEIGPNVEAETIEEVGKLISEDTVDLSAKDVENIAKMTRVLEEEITPEEVKVVAESKMKMGPRLSQREMQATVMKAKQKTKGEGNLDAAGVHIISEVMDMLASEISNDEVEVISILTKAADQDISSQQSVKSPFGSVNNAFAEEAAEETAELIKSMGPDMSRREEAVVIEMVNEMKPELNTKEAEVMVKVLTEMAAIVDAAVVEDVAEMVSEPDVDISPSEVEKVADVVEEMSQAVTATEVKVVADLAERMGPVITGRELQMISRMSKSAQVDLPLGDIAKIAEITKVLGQDVSPNEAQIVADISTAKKVEDNGVGKDGGPVLNNDEAEEIAEVVEAMGTHMSTSEVQELEQVLEDVAPELTENEVDVMTEILQQLGPEVNAETVQKVAEISKEADEESLTPHVVEAIADMAKEVETDLSDEKDLETVVDLVERTGPEVSPREMQMITRMAKSSGVKIETKEDIEVIEDMVKMLGPEISDNDLEVMEVFLDDASTNPDGNNKGGSSSQKKEDAGKVVEALQEVGNVVTFEEVQEIESVIEEMEPLMTKSKVQVMSQLLLEMSENVDQNDVAEIAEVVMEASDDITPSDVVEVAEMTRNVENQLTTKEVKAIAEMSEQMGESLSVRETQMIARMMRSSGLTVTMNDIQVVAEASKILGSDMSEADAKLVAIMTKMTPGTTSTTVRTPAATSSLPPRPQVSSLPERSKTRFVSQASPPRTLFRPRQPTTPPTSPPRTESPTRLSMNVRLKNRLRPRPPTQFSGSYLPPPPSSETEVVEPPPPETEGFGLRQNGLSGQRLPPQQQLPSQPQPEPQFNAGTQFPNFPNPPMPTIPTRTPFVRVRPTSLPTPFPTTTHLPLLAEDTSQLSLEEFLMRRRPTPFRNFPSERPPEEDEFAFAVDPTSGEPINDIVETNRSPNLNQQEGGSSVVLPGGGFMQISMAGQDILKENSSPSSSSSQETFNSLVNNGDPNSMLTNFLMKKNLPTPRPTLPPRPPPPTPVPTRSWSSHLPTRNPLKGLFKLESTTLDRTPSGNFLHMKMGDKTPAGVDPSILPTLEANKIDLSGDGNSFMSINLNGNAISRRVSNADLGERQPANNEKNNLYREDIRLPALNRPPRQPSFNMGSKFGKNKEPRPTAPTLEDKVDPTIWPEEADTPFTVRPTLPVGQVKLLPSDLGYKYTATPFTVRPTKKPFINLATKKPYGFQKTKSLQPHQTMLKTTATRFWVRPTKTPTSHSYSHNSAALVGHDVALKSPFDAQFGGNLRNHHHVSNSHPHANNGYGNNNFPSYFDTSTDDYGNFDYLDDGYKGLVGELGYPGLHDDRPPILPTVGFDNPFDQGQSYGDDDVHSTVATFGDAQFKLPKRGRFPDRPLEDEILRDMPGLEQLDYNDDDDSDGDYGSTPPQFGKSYLENPFGADFIRLEVDSSRYRHNKTRRLGIHHIPLKVNGYAETSQYPVHGERVTKKAPPSMKDHAGPSKSKPIMGGIGSSLTAMKDAMGKLPKAINKLPDFMHQLMSGNKNWLNEAWSAAVKGDQGSPKSLDSIVQVVDSSASASDSSSDTKTVVEVQDDSENSSHESSRRK